MLPPPSRSFPILSIASLQMSDRPIPSFNYLVSFIHLPIIMAKFRLMGESTKAVLWRKKGLHSLSPLSASVEVVCVPCEGWENLGMREVHVRRLKTPPNAI